MDLHDVLYGGAGECVLKRRFGSASHEEPRQDLQ